MPRTLFTWIIGIVLLMPTVSFAEPKVGDTVKVEWLGKMVDAKIIEAKKKGWYRVQFQFRGHVMRPTIQSHRVYAGEGDVEQKLSEKERESLKELRDNKDGKNVSSKEYREWHEPGKAGKKLGQTIGVYRVKAYRKGSPLILFESKPEKGEEPKEWVARLPEIANVDRAELFKLFRKKP